MSSTELSGATPDFYVVIDTTTDPANPSSTITITGFTNVCTSALPCAAAENNLGTLSIEENVRSFTIQGGPFSAAIPDLASAQSINVTNANALTITSLADNTELPIHIIIKYSSVSVVDIVTMANDITDIIASSFFYSPTSTSQTLNVALSADTNTILLSGTNFEDGSGSIAGSPSLPDGYAVTTSSGVPYTFADPDGTDLTAYAATALTEGVLSIAERDANNAVVNGNEITFAVTLELAAMSTLEQTDLTLSPEHAQVTIDHENEEIIITKLTNACSIPPCIAAEDNAIGMLTITAASTGFTLTKNTETVTEVDIAIPDQDGATNTPDVPLGSVTFQRTGDRTSFTYAVIAQYSGTPVSEIISNVLPPAQVTAADIIASSFFYSPTSTSQTLNVALSADTSTILLSGTNFEDGSGSIVGGPSLPNGYAATTSSGVPYTFADPDGTDLTAYAATALTEGVLSIAERDTDDAVVNGNEITFAITLQLNAMPTLEQTHITFNPDLADAIVDHENEEIIITKLTNACSIPPCIAAEDNAISTLTITAASTVFTLTKNAETVTEVDIAIPDQDGATNTPDVPLASVTFQRTGDRTSFTYEVIAQYSGTPISEIISNVLPPAQLTAADIIASSFFYSPTSTSQTLNVALSADTSTILLSGTNFEDGSGSIVGGPSLPDGYAATTSSGVPYTFADPDGTDLTAYAATALTEGVLSLAERDANNAVVNGNEITFAVTLQLNAMPTLEQTHITFSPDLADAIVDHENEEIIITKLTNACSLPPCIAAEDNAISTLTITAASTVFTLTKNTETVTEIDIAIPDQDGATNTPDVPLGSVTFQRTGDRTSFTYEVIAQYSSMAVAELINNAGGIENMLPPAQVTVSYGSIGQDAVVSWNNDVLTISKLSNLPGTVETGTVTPASSLLPTGYYVSSYMFTDPTGNAATNLDVSEAIVIAEGDAAIEPPVIDNNQAFYDLHIPMKATPDVVLTASDLDISITNTLNAIQDVATSDITVGYDPPTVTITAAANIHNFNEAELRGKW